MEWLLTILDKIYFLIIPIGIPFLLGSGLTAKYMGDQFRKKLSDIQDELMGFLERDKVERDLNVDIYMGKIYESEKWIEEFLIKLNSGQIEIKWT